jgi:hypothetical protein
MSMSVATGAWLAAVAGGATGALDVLVRRTPARGSVWLRVFGGAAIGAAAYAMFVAAGMVVSVLTFGSTPDAGPALISVIVGCAAFLLLRGLHAVVAPRFGMPERRRAPSERRTLTDLIGAQPRGGAPTMWLGGVGFALLPLIYGISCIITRRGELGTVIWPSEVQGAAAIALGVGWIGVGLFLHFHFFFGLHVGLASFSRRGKAVALVMAGAGLTLAGAWSVFTQIPRV